MSGYKSSGCSADIDLTNKLKEIGLDPAYWLSILEECLGIYNIQSLNYIQPEDCSVIEEKICYPWEKRALHKLFNIPDSSVKIAEVQEKRNRLIKEKNKQAHNVLAELKTMSSEGKCRQDDVVKECEKEMWKILEVPSEYSALPEKSLLDLINYFENQIYLREESFSKKENLPDEEVIQHSSGGLALEGIFQTKNAEDLFKKREPLLCIPEGFKLVGPEQSPIFEQKEFSSQEAESNFHRTVEKIGLSLSSSITAGFMGFGLKSSSNYTNSVESEHTRKQIKEILKKSEELIKSKENSKTINKLCEKYEDEMLSESKKLALSLQGKNVTEKELQEKFNLMWNSLITEVTEQTYTPKSPEINCDLENVFLERFKNEPNIADTIKDSYHWKDLLQIFSIYIASKRTYLLWKEKLSDDDQKTIKRTITILNRRMDEYMDTKQQEKLDYQQVYFHELLNIIISEINSTLGTFKFKKDFTLYASLFLCQKAACRFKKDSEAFRKANDPLVYLGCKRNEFWQSFKISCEGKKQITTLADFLCTKLEEAIRQGVYEKSALHLAGELKTYNQALNGNRSKLEFCLLRSLAEDENFQQYIDYINDPKSAITDFIQKCVEQYCEDNKKISEIINIKLDEFENIILKAINKSTTIVSDKNGDICEWLDIFCSQLGSDMKLSSHDLKSVKYHNITDIVFLKEAMTQALKTVLEKLKDSFFKCDLTHLVEKIHGNLCKQFSGCWAKCPFCGAVCSNTIPGHYGDHCVQYHRPAALIGWQCTNTNHFTVDFCTSLVSTDLCYVLPNYVRIPYKSYRNGGYPYNSWSITPDHSSLLYWKWVTYFFRGDFENHYNFKFTGRGAIPAQWGSIKKQEAIDELEKYM